MRTIVGVLGLVVAVGCSKGKQLSAHVDCEVRPGPTVVCTIEQSDHDAKHQVCFDFAVRCARSGLLTIPHRCVDVNGPIVFEHTTTAEQVTTTGECSGEQRFEVTNLTIDGKPVR